jgi:hypothetical protein
MANAPGFIFNTETGNIIMNAGDTGSFKVHCARKSGENWTENSRMLFTVRDPQGEIVMQRIYRLDDQWGLGDGVVLIEFHNDDTDDWAAGTYSMERRYNVAPVWEGTPSTARCVNALTSSARMVEGVPVRTVFKGTIDIESVSGRI